MEIILGCEQLFENEWVNKQFALLTDYIRSICSTFGSVVPQGASSITVMSFLVKRHSLDKNINSGGVEGRIITNLL